MNDDQIEALRELHAIIYKLHHGRMPAEVATAMDKARAALAAHDAQPAAQPLSDAISLMRQAAWSEAPRRTEWGAGMMVADVALAKDETMTLYAHRDALYAAKEPK